MPGCDKAGPKKPGAGRGSKKMISGRGGCKQGRRFGLGGLMGKGFLKGPRL